MCNNILISFIVPVYNTEKFLSRCLESVYSQGFEEEEFEVIVVNDGSTDNSQTVIDAYFKNKKNLISIIQNNRGLSAARNIGVERARGKYITFIDSDDFFEPKAFVKIVSIAEREQSELCFFHMKFTPGSDKIINPQPFDYNKNYSGEYALLNGMNVSSACANIYNREFLLKIGIRFTEGIYHEDIDFNYRLYPFVNRLSFTNVMAYNYFINTNSITKSKNKEMMHKRLLDNILVIANIRDFCIAKEGQLSTPLKKYYREFISSATMGILCLAIKNQKFLGYSIIKESLCKLREKKLYPIQHHTKSILSSFIRPVINFSFVYIFIAYIARHLKLVK